MINRKQIFLVLIVFTFSVILLRILSPNLCVLQQHKLTHTNHYLDPPMEGNEGYLPSADGEEFSPPERSIFFIETSSHGNIDPRQACAVESAARTHPRWQINILFTAPVTNKTLRRGNLALIQTIDNVKLHRIHIKKYAEGTPIESMVARDSLNKSRYLVFHTSDVLRYLTLYKRGGIYLDFDVVVVKSLESLAKNWAVREGDLSISSGALAFSNDHIGRTVANASIRNLNKTFRGDKWNNNGPGVITRVLKDLCSTDKVKLMSAATCAGFEIYNITFMYPIPWKRCRDYFKKRELAPNERHSYIYHMFSHISNKFKIKKGSPYAKLAKKFCPKVYKKNAAHFGSKS